MGFPRRHAPSPVIEPPLCARLRRVRSSGLLYGGLDPQRWYRIERQNLHTLWIITSHGLVEVVRQDVEVREVQAASVHGGR